MKGGQKYRGRGYRNRLAEQGCRGQEGPGEQVEGGKIVCAGREVEARGSGRLSRRTGDPRPEEKEENQVLKEWCISVYGWRMGRGGSVYKSPPRRRLTTRRHQETGLHNSGWGVHTLEGGGQDTEGDGKQSSKQLNIGPGFR